jgi:tetratricopeptide (TPR) repeat protein
VDIRLRLSDACRDSGDHARALRELDEIVGASPNYLPARLHYGIALYSAGRRAEAVKAWEDVLARNPGNKTAEMYLSLVGEGGKGEVAS